jgi:hypothetical protein
MITTSRVCGLAMGCLISASVAVANTAHAGGNINVLYGQKIMEDAWEPADKQGEIGVMADFSLEGSPNSASLNLAIDIRRSDDTGTFGGDEFTGETSELAAGVRFYTGASGWRGYFGVGLSVIKAEFSGLGLSDSDTALGLWVSGGGMYTFGGNINVGAELRSSTGNVELFGVEADPGGLHLSGFVGYAF